MNLHRPRRLYAFLGALGVLGFALPTAQEPVDPHETALVKIQKLLATSPYRCGDPETEIQRLRTAILEIKYDLIEDPKGKGHWQAEQARSDTDMFLWRHKWSRCDKRPAHG